MKQLKGLRAEDWAELRLRYDSNRQYKLRRISWVAAEDLEYFEQWLIDKGADILATNFQNEVLRFSIDGVFGIVYTSKSGSLLAHDMADKFELENEVVA